MSEKIRAGRNRTLTLSEKEHELYNKHLLRSEKGKQFSASEITDKTICGDLFETIDYLPKGFADFIIIAPPYNLTKDFHGFKFKSTSKNEYLDYLRSWFPKICQLLKPNGSLYLCGDWKNTMNLQ